MKPRIQPEGSKPKPVRAKGKTASRGGSTGKPVDAADPHGNVDRSEDTSPFKGKRLL